MNQTREPAPALTAEQFWDIYKVSPFTRKQWLEFAEAYAAHVTAALRAERDELRDERDNLWRSRETDG